MNIRRVGDDWLLGDPAAAPWLVGVVEGAGATLWWPADGGRPGGLVWDAPTASGWIDEVWPGTTATLAEAGAFGAGTDAVRDGAGGGSAVGRLASAARAAALAGWRAAWWPASRIAGIPPLDPRLVWAELVAARAELDGALDDDDAVTRALREHAAAVRRFGEFGPVSGRDASEILGGRPHGDTAPVGAEELGAPDAPAGSGPAIASGLIRRVARIADDHGVEIEAAAATPRADDYALAASGRAVAAPLASGETRIDPSALPSGVVDPAGSVAWSVALGAGGAILSVTAPAAPRFADAPPANRDLRARVADAEVPLALRGEAWSGEAVVAASFLVLPVERRSAALFVPGFDPSPPDASHPGYAHPGPAEHPADALIRIAGARLAARESVSEGEAR